jgi:hypothetical protein
VVAFFHSSTVKLSPNVLDQRFLPAHDFGAGKNPLDLFVISGFSFYSAWLKGQWWCRSVAGDCCLGHRSNWITEYLCLYYFSDRIHIRAVACPFLPTEIRDNVSVQR